MNINTNTNTDAKHINVCIQFIIHCWNNEYFSVDAASATPTAVNTVRINGSLQLDTLINSNLF